jgi:hypothetical protein
MTDHLSSDARLLANVLDEAGLVIRIASEQLLGAMTHGMVPDNTFDRLDECGRHIQDLVSRRRATPTPSLVPETLP